MRFVFSSRLHLKVIRPHSCWSFLEGTAQVLYLAPAALNRLTLHTTLRSSRGRDSELRHWHSFTNDRNSEVSRFWPNYSPDTSIITWNYNFFQNLSAFSFIFTRQCYQNHRRPKPHDQRRLVLANNDSFLMSACHHSVFHPFAICSLLFHSPSVWDATVLFGLRPLFLHHSF